MSLNTAYRSLNHMYRYIKSSFDPSIPSWVKNAISSRGMGDAFVKQFKVPLSEVQFYDEEVPGSMPIYLLKTDYGSVAYIPGLNDTQQEYFNGRNRQLGSIAKSKLPSMSEDIAYVDISNKLENSGGYRDPRYSYDTLYKNTGDYAGQYYNEYRGKWSDTGAIPRNEAHPRDKSGYKVPTPESQLTRYYEKFPEKVTQKVDALYDRIIAVRDRVMSPDIINTPYNRDEEMDIGNAIYRVRDAITGYRELLAMLDKETGTLKKSDDIWVRGTLYQNFADRCRKISESLDAAERGLTSRWI